MKKSLVCSARSQFITFMPGCFHRAPWWGISLPYCVQAYTYHSYHFVGRRGTKLEGGGL